MTQVAGQILQPGKAALVAQRIECLWNTSGSDRPRSYRAVSRILLEPRGVGGHLQMEPQLLFEVAIGPMLPQGPPKPIHPLAERRHRMSVHVIPRGSGARA